MRDHLREHRPLEEGGDPEGLINVHEALEQARALPCGPCQVAITPTAKPRGTVYAPRSTASWQRIRSTPPSKSCERFRQSISGVRNLPSVRAVQWHIRQIRNAQSALRAVD